MVRSPLAPKMKKPGRNSRNTLDMFVQARINSTAYPNTAMPSPVRNTWTVDRNFRIRGYSSIMDRICTPPPKVLNRV